ncbi:hypothetical protein FQA39_LY00626 [Lamprigera yunnana]|nr:hypothetical protein FQA39_LY00626 [Lamprigera yunnana]
MDEKLAWMRSLKETTKGSDIVQGCQETITSLKILLTNICNITTDGAPSMTGTKSGFVGIFKESFSGTFTTKSSLTYCKDLDMEKEQLHNTQSEIEDLTLIEHLAEGFETRELEIVQDTQPTISIATGSNSCSITSDPSPIEFMSHKRRRVETTDNADTLTESIQMIGSKMQNLIDSSNAVDPLDQDILFGNSVAAFLNKCPEGKAKNEFKKKVFILMMDHEFQ